MAALAGLLKERGFRVTGSDNDCYPPMSTLLAELGIEVRSPYAPANLPQGVDLVVVGNALSRGNPELEAVLERRLPYVSMPEVLKDLFLRGRTAVVVAGTHGKTTTSSLRVASGVRRARSGVPHRRSSLEFRPELPLGHGPGLRRRG